MTFSTSRLVGSKVLVQGTDVFGTAGQTILDSTQWDEVNSNKEFDQATSAFDAAVEAFFAPLTEAAEKLDRAVADKPTDSVGYVVLNEAVEGVAAQPAHLIKLTSDSVVLRLIEQGDTNRLVWVGDDLEVLESAPAPAVPVDVSSD